MISLHLIAVWLLSVPVFAQLDSKESPLGMTCMSAAMNFNFGCSKANSTSYKFLSCSCANPAFMGTAVTCVRQNIPSGDASEIEYAYEYIQETCNGIGKSYTFTQLEDVYYNSTNFLTSVPSNNNTLSLDPIEVKDASFMTSLKIYNYTPKHQYKKSTLYGCMLLAYWAGVFLLASIHNFILHFYTDVLFRAERAIGFGRVRKYFTLTAAFSEAHSRPLKIIDGFLHFSAPTRGQTFILLGYLILNLVFLLVSYDSPLSGIDANYTHKQYLKLLANRAGILAYIQVPAIVLFACRNNWLIHLTGWPYNTFQVYHRWVARTMVTLAVIHCSIYFHFVVPVHMWTYKMTHSTLWKYGFTAVLAGALMVLTALHSVRSRFYEVFYALHKILYLTFIICLGSHVWRMDWMLFIWIAVGIHGAERITRLLKVIFSGFKNSAIATLHDDDVITVSVKYSSRWELRPGQYCYIRILHSNLFWQAHPFSVYKSPSPGDNTIHFAIKTRTGATKKLRDFLQYQPSRSADIPVFIEGPYGHEAPVQKFDHLLLMAGGIGVTATYSYALEARGRGQHVVFMWIIQDLQPLEWFGDELLALTGDPGFELQIYVTRNFGLSGGETEADDDLESALYTTNGDDEKSYECQETTQERTPPRTKSVSSAQRIKDQYANIFMGRRPDVREEVTKLMSNRGTIAVVSCGPPAFVDNIRSSIVKNITDTEERVDYFEEAFSW